MDITLLLGDNRKYLFGDEIEESSIDLVVTSPPYDNLRKYGGHPFGMAEFYGVLSGLWRVVKDGGVVVWVVGDATIKGSETGTSFKQALAFKDVGFRLHDTMLYAKNNYVPLTHNRYEQQFEYTFIFSKGKPKTFNPIMIPTKTAGSKKIYNYETAATFEKKSAIRSGRQRNDVVIIKDKKIKPNIWYYSVGNNKSSKDRNAFKVPAVFPEQLVHDHIISWSNPGDVVLDPFMGSGTTGKVAVNLNRNFIGVEINEEYFNVAKERIYNE